MKNLGRFVQVTFLAVLLVTTAATLSAVAQDTTASADQSTAYPQSQAPPPPVADQTGPSPSGQQVDPPGRAARLGYMTGSVSIQPQGTGDWVDGSVNRPLTIGDNVWADKDSRAELNLGTGVMRISSETSLTITNVTNDAVQVQLHQGTLNVHVRKIYGGEVYEIDTPNQAFTVTKDGDYRFDVDPAGDATVVTVWKGEGEATGQGPAIRVHAGQQARFTNGNSLTSQIGVAPKPDGFDEWCQVRDRGQDNSVSARYVAPGVVGSSDLDEYGAWRQTPAYGPVWVPTAVAPGWAPYSTGHWAWVAPWGWTWVDDAPWGFAPFHYGRWVSFGGYWGWAPGPYYARPYYAPALVAWFGGPGFGIGFGFGFGGGFGWCPLGFGEPFFPWYHASPGYFRNVNINNTHITNITNITNNYYNNRNGASLYGRNGIQMPRYARTGALTAVPRNTLERGLPVSASAARTSPNALRNLSAASISRPDVSPTRASVLGPKAGLPAAKPSAGVTSRPTVSRMTPPASSARPSAQPSTPARTTTSPSPGRVAEGPSTSARSMPAPAGRYVPRPPQSLGSSNTAAISSRGVSSPAMNRITSSGPAQTAMNHNVPQPQQSGTRSVSQPTMARPGVASSNSPMSRSVPRPPQGSMSQPTVSARNTVPNSAAAPRSYSTPYFGRGTPSSAPRSSGQISPAPRSYSSPQNRVGSYSARSYNGGGYGNYGGSRGYSAPSYGGRGYSGPSYGGSSGGHSYSAPSSHSSGSFGGYHASSGGSHASSGGGSSHGGHGR
jgi:FecR protein